jgi:hypothetical protein
MSTNAVLPIELNVHVFSVHCNRFAPFVKGGYGGFALRVIEEQEQIPLDPPFSKGERKLLRVAALLPCIGESCTQVAA